MFGALRFARMAGSSLAAPDAAGWVTDFLNAAYYARPPAERDVADLRLAYGIVTTRWDRLGRRLRIYDAIAFHRAFGVDRFLRSPRLTLTHDSSARAARGCSATGSRTRGRTRRAAAGASRSPIPPAAPPTSPRSGCSDAALGRLSAPGAPEAQRHWSTYPAVPLPSADAAVATLSDTSRWPDFGCAGGRFTALRGGGLEGQTFEIEVVAHPAPRTPVFTRGYVTATGLHTEPDAIVERLGRAALDEPALPEGATPRLLLELTTHEGHFLGPAVSRLVVWEEDGAAFIRDVGEWDPLPAHLAVPFRLAGRAAQVAFWGGGAPEASMLHQLALVVADRRQPRLGRRSGRTPHPAARPDRLHSFGRDPASTATLGRGGRPSRRWRRTRSLPGRRRRCGAEPGRRRGGARAPAAA